MDLTKLIVGGALAVGAWKLWRRKEALDERAALIRDLEARYGAREHWPAQLRTKVINVIGPDPGWW